MRDPTADNEGEQAGLNLNLAGAVSGLFASKSDKGTAADGSTTEHREERAGVKGAFSWREWRVRSGEADCGV